MRVTREMIEHLAHTSRLRLSPEEMELYQGQLEGVFGMFEQLSSIDTEGVEPTYQVHGLTNALREDLPESDGSENTILQQAPGGTKDGQFKTPSTF